MRPQHQHTWFSGADLWWRHCADSTYEAPTQKTLAQTTFTMGILLFPWRGKLRDWLCFMELQALTLVDAGTWRGQAWIICVPTPGLTG